MTGTAVDIYQAHLDQSTRLVFEGKARAYCDHAQLPFVLRTGEGIEVIETVADLENDIGKLNAWLRQEGVTDYHRIARSARFLDEETIEGFHVTYALRRAMPVVDPYCSRMILRLVDGTWRTCFAEHELADSLYLDRLARAQPGLFAAEWSGAAAPITRDQTLALDLYSRRITSFAVEASAGDFDGWLAHYTLPHTVHYDRGDSVVETREDARRFFDLLQETMRRYDADTFRVEPLSAVFLSDVRLLGYHHAMLTREGEIVFGPIRSRMILTNDTGIWRCHSVANAISTAAFQGGVYEPSAEFPTMREIQKRMKT